MRYFVFCQSDVVLEREGDHYKIPEETPVEQKAWTTVMDVDGDKAYRIDAPLTGHLRYEMCPLRQSYYEAPLSESWQVSGTTLLGSKYTLLRCVWCPYADGYRYIKKVYRMW